MDWMSPMDASFLHLEGPMNPMHVGGVSVFEGPAPSFERLEEMVTGKLGLVPRYRQKIRFVPLGLGRPVWVDDPHFNLSYHLRHTALPAPGGEDQLRRTAARIFAQHLDRNKPLWEIWAVEGLSESRWALLSKVHHCMVDGVSATDLMSVMFEGTPASDRAWEPAPEPTGTELVLRTLTRRTLNPSEQLRSVRAAVRAPRASLVQARDLLRGMTSAAGLIRPLGSSSLTGSVGPHRKWSCAHVRLSDVKLVRAELGGTVNDVVLTIVSGGLRDLLEARGEPVANRTIRALVPVSVRRPNERGVYNNRVSAMFAELPVGIADPAARLDAVRAQLDGLKKSKQAVAGDVLTSLSGFAPPVLLALGARLAARSPSLGLQTGVTNVPGPQQPLHTLGRRLLESFPVVPLIGHVRSRSQFSPMTAAFTSASPATTTAQVTSTSSPPGSSGRWQRCSHASDRRPRTVRRQSRRRSQPRANSPGCESAARLCPVAITPQVEVEQARFLDNLRIWLVRIGSGGFRWWDDHPLGA